MTEGAFRYSPRGGARLQGLTSFLYGLREDCVVISFDDLERETGCRLNASMRRHQSTWSNSSTYARYWKDTGYQPSFRDVPDNHISFIRAE